MKIKMKIIRDKYIEQKNSENMLERIMENVQSNIIHIIN